MKKRFLFTVIIIGIVAVSSVRAQFRIGPGIGFITEVRTIMLSASVNYDFSEKFGAMVEYDYIFAKTSSHKWWGLDFNGTYKFNSQNETSNWYALAGLNSLHQTYPGHNFSYIGLNLGTGWRKEIGNKMELVPEATITIGELSYIRLGVKLMFSL